MALTIDWRNVTVGSEVASQGFELKGGAETGDCSFDERVVLEAI